VLRQDAPIPIRGGFVDEAAAQRDARDRMRQAGDLMRKVNQFQFLSCACGMRIKLPPDFNRDALPCPRCGAVLQVAQAQPLSAAADTPDPGVAPTPIPTAQPRRTLPWTPPVAAPRNPTLPPLEVARTGSGWMSFKCSCGAVKNLAPSFDAPETHCSACGRIIHIRAAQ
jgi:heat shock protein HtpX